MSRILRRPMFRGGRVDSYGTGIASGLGRQNYDEGGEVMKMREEILNQIPQKKGLSTGDYLRIASAGLDIVGAPGETGGILGGTLSAASKPLSKLGVDLGTSMDKRGQAREDLATTLTGAGLDYKVGMAKANKLSATEISLNTIQAYYDELIATEQTKENPNTILIENYKSERDYAKLDVAQGGNKASKFRILNPQNIEMAQDVVIEALTVELGREPTIEEIEKGVTQYLLGVVKNFDKGLSGLADGGRVGKANGGITETADVNMMTETPTGTTDVNVQETETVPEQTNEINISYDQLRDRLPPEITDDIVLLISQSYEALADFSEIQTQADVNQFNTKYNVQLFLPQQSGA